MFVALFDNQYGKDFPDFDNFLDMVDIPFLPNVNSVMEYQGEYYKIEHYRPITFHCYENREIMCVFLSLMFFESESSHTNLVDFFNTHKAKERKYKIKKVLGD